MRNFHDFFHRHRFRMDPRPLHVGEKDLGGTGHAEARVDAAAPLELHLDAVLRTVSIPFTTLLCAAPAAAARDAAESSAAVPAVGAAGAVGAPASRWLMSKPRTARAYR